MMGPRSGHHVAHNSAARFERQIPVLPDPLLRGSLGLAAPFVVGFYLLYLPNPASLCACDVEVSIAKTSCRLVSFARLL